MKKYEEYEYDAEVCILIPTTDADTHKRIKAALEEADKQNIFPVANYTAEKYDEDTELLRFDTEIVSESYDVDFDSYYEDAWDYYKEYYQAGPVQYSAIISNLAVYSPEQEVSEILSKIIDMSYVDIQLDYSERGFEDYIAEKETEAKN